MPELNTDSTEPTTANTPAKNRFARIALTLVITAYSIWAATILAIAVSSLLAVASQQNSADALTFIVLAIAFGSILLMVLYLASIFAFFLAVVGGIYGILGLKKSRTLNKVGYKASLTSIVLGGLALIPAIYVFITSLQPAHL